MNIAFAISVLVLNRPKRISRLSWLFLLPLALFLPPEAMSQFSSESSTICTGYNPEAKRWGFVGNWLGHPWPEKCPKNYAIVGVRTGRGKPKSPASVSIVGMCCPLPEGVLGDTHVWVEDTCPPGFVASGGKTESPEINKYCYEHGPLACLDKWNSITHYLRCTKINGDLYALSNEIPGQYWGWQPNFSTSFDTRIKKTDIKPSLRYALGRDGEMHWFPDGCVGETVGALLVAKKNKYCSGFIFKTLLHAYKKGKKQENKPVALFSSCLSIDDPLSKNPHCTAHMPPKR